MLLRALPRDAATYAVSAFAILYCVGMHGLSQVEMATCSLRIWRLSHDDVVIVTKTEASGR